MHDVNMWFIPFTTRSGTKNQGVSSKVKSLSELVLILIL